MSDPFERIAASARETLLAHWEARIQRALIDATTPEAERLEILEQLQAALASGDAAALEMTMAALRAVAKNATMAEQARVVIRAAMEKLKASLDARAAFGDGGFDARIH